MSNIKLGYRTDDGDFVVLKEKDRFGHIIIEGPTGCGKTSKIIIPGIWQDLIDIKIKRIKYNYLKQKYSLKAQLKINDFSHKLTLKYKALSVDEKLDFVNNELQEYISFVNAWKEKKLNRYKKTKYLAGLSLLEPKGDLVDETKLMCNALDLDYKYLNPMDPKTHRFNVMYGDPDVVAECNRTVLRDMFGKQEAFFEQMQGTMARNTILLIKRVRNNNVNLIDVVRVLRDDDTLKKEVEYYENMLSAPLPGEERGDDLSAFFRLEVVGAKPKPNAQGKPQKSRSTSKLKEFAIGLRQQIEDICQNRYLKRILEGDTQIDMDEHLAEGGILLVNTAMGELGHLGDVFGQFVIMHLENAVFRRPGNENNRANHYIWIDEAKRYINLDFERLMAIGRSFRAAVTLAIQAKSQLEEKDENFAKTIFANSRNKIVFGGISEEDAKFFENEFGKEKRITKEYSYEFKHVNVKGRAPKNYRRKIEQVSRFDFTQIKELKSEGVRAEAIAQICKGGSVQKASKIITQVIEKKKGQYLKPKKIIRLEEKYKSRLNRVRLIHKSKNTLSNIIQSPVTATTTLLKMLTVLMGNIFSRLSRIDKSNASEQLLENNNISIKSNSNSIKFVVPESAIVSNESSIPTNDIIIDSKLVLDTKEKTKNSVGTDKSIVEQKAMPIFSIECNKNLEQPFNQEEKQNNYSIVNEIANKMPILDSETDEPIEVAIIENPQKTGTKTTYKKKTKEIIQEESIPDAPPVQEEKKKRGRPKSTEKSAAKSKDKKRNIATQDLFDRTSPKISDFEG